MSLKLRMSSTSFSMDNKNIAARLAYWAEQTPHNIAVNHPERTNDGFKYIEYSFSQLEKKANSIAFYLKNNGVTKGQKILCFVRPKRDFSAIVFALFKIGSIPICIDPVMGKKNLLKAIEQIQPESMIAEPEVHFISKLYRSKFRTIKNKFTTGSFKFLGTVKSLKDAIETEQVILEHLNDDDEAAVLFTSGGTGIPKGVQYTHSIFNAQTDILKRMFNLTSEDVDLPGFPLFSLFTIAMGMKSSIPFMNPSKPSQANPEFLVKNINDQKATFVAGSPAIWKGVAEYCLKNNIQLPTVKYLVMFGAPVNKEMHENFSKILTNGTTYTPYGATECLPVSNTSGKEILSLDIDQDKLNGTFIGKVIEENQVKIIKTTDDILNWDNVKELALGEIGEIIIHGPTTTKLYVGMEDKTKEAKIIDNDGKTWHRMGDLGYLDQNQNLWFCGRKTHRVNLDQESFVSSIPHEIPFMRIRGVNKVALIPAVNNQGKAALVIEKKKDVQNEHILKDIKAINEQIIREDIIKEYYQYKELPVDVRHNIKIDRVKLANMAKQGRLRELQ